MITGHYGVSYALKKFDNRFSLGWLALSVHFLDILHSSFVLLGIEHARLVPGITQVIPVELVYYPYSHSLPMALFWSTVLGIIFYFAPVRYGTTKLRIALIMAAGCFSHWIADLLMHNADLPLWGDQYKVGFAWWQHRWFAMTVEAATLFGGLMIYLGCTKARPHNFFSKWGNQLFCVISTILFIASMFVPMAKTIEAISIELLVIYAVIMATLFWLDSIRDPNP